MFRTILIALAKLATLRIPAAASGIEETPPPVAHVTIERVRLTQDQLTALKKQYPACYVGTNTTGEEAAYRMGIQRVLDDLAAGWIV